jgi:hypothetical protein
MSRFNRVGKYQVSPAEQRTWNGRVYASKAEMHRAQELEICRLTGDVREFIEQPLFKLGAGITYRPDFLVIGPRGDVYAEDVKGVETAEFKLKVKLWRENIRIQLHVLKRKGKGWDREVIEGAKP